MHTYITTQCHADRHTPYDPHLPSLFDGEEFSKYARLWTRCVAFKPCVVGAGG